MKVFLTIVLVIISFISRAQWQYGVGLGAGVSSINYKYINTKFSPSYYIGLEGRRQLNKRLIYQAQLRHSYKGVELLSHSIYRDDLGIMNRESVVKLNYVGVSSKLLIDVGKPNGFVITPGIYVMRGIYGKEVITDSTPYEVDNYEERIKFENNPNTGQTKYLPWDIGWALAIGYSWDRMLIDVEVNRGIMGLHSTSGDSKNLTFRAGVSYLLTKKENKVSNK